MLQKEISYAKNYSCKNGMIAKYRTILTFCLFFVLTILFQMLTAGW